MSISKVAKIFQRKLSLASANTLEDLRKVMGYASALSAGYDYTDPAYDATQALASRAYQLWMAAKNPKTTMTASQMKVQLSNLTNLANQIGGLIGDQTGQKKLNAFKWVLNSVQPTDIGIKAPPPAPAQEPLSSELLDVVQNQAPEPSWERQYPTRSIEPVQQQKAPEPVESEGEDYVTTEQLPEESVDNPNWKFHQSNMVMPKTPNR